MMGTFALNEARARGPLAGLVFTMLLMLFVGAVKALEAPVKLWIPAKSGTLHGDMVKGRTYAEQSICKEVVFPSSDVKNTGNQNQDDFVAYRIDIPATDNYVLWARMFYPADTDIRNRPNSFFLSVDADLPRVLGNSESTDIRWRWEGLRELPLPLGRLSQGEHILRLWRREALESRKASPRLDVICMTNDATYQPSDADVRLATGPFTVSADRLAKVTRPPGEGECRQVNLWVTAADGERHGKMALTQAEGSLGPAVLYPHVDLHNVDDETRDHQVVYEVNIPETGLYFVWGRLAYPGEIANNPNSFFVAIDDTLPQVLGNVERKGVTWRWEGQRSLQAVPLGNLVKGRHLLKVWSREAMISRQSVPYLDMLLVTNNPAYVPVDADVEPGMSPSR